MTENNGGTPEENPEPGYWEQQAAANPPEEQPPAAPPPFGQPAYGQPQYGQPPYGQPQPQYGQPYPQQPYPPQPGYTSPAYNQPYSSYSAPDHPKATTALVLGLIGLVGGFMCLLPVLVSPFAWFTGMKARREIRASNGQLGGDGMATAGMVLGIIGTVLLALILIGIVVFVIVVANDPTVFDDGSTV